MLHKRLSGRLGRLLDTLAELVAENPGHELAPAIGDLAGPAVGWQPEGWPADLPYPLTAAAALEAVRKGAAVLVSETEADIRAAVAAMVAPESQSAALNRPALAAGWPWHVATIPRRGGAVWHGQAYGPRLAMGRLLRVWATKVDPSDLGRWPDENLSHGQVAEWAADRLNELPPPDSDDLARWDVRHALEGTSEWAAAGGLLGEWLRQATKEHGEIRQTPVIKRTDGAPLPLRREVLALLYLAELQGAGRRGFGATFALDVTTPTKRAMQSLGGAHPKLIRSSRNHAPAGTLLQETDLASLTFSWDDGQSTILELPLEAEGYERNPLRAIADRYGPKAMVDLMVLYGLAWARGGNCDSLWWWPDEHLELRGTANSQENRRAVSAMFERLSRTRLVAHYADGGKLEGPIVTQTLADGEDAKRISLHPALYRGIREGYFWPMPIGLLHARTNDEEGRVHLLAVVAGNMFRAGLGNDKRDRFVAKLRAQRLADQLSIKWRHDATRDSRAGETLRRTLESGQMRGLLGAWESSTDLANPEALITMRAGQSAIDAINSRSTPWPSWIPATGYELEEWLRREGMTATELARQMGQDERTMRRAAAYRERPLSTGVRRALRHWLWADILRTDTSKGCLTR